MLLSTLMLLASTLSADHFTAQQRNLLQTAVNAQYLSNRITEAHTSCKSGSSGDEWDNLQYDLKNYPAKSTIEHRLAIPAHSLEQFTTTLNLRPNRSAAHWKDVELTCDETRLWHQLFDDYREVYFQLELSQRLEQSFADSLALMQQSQLLQQQGNQTLIDESNSIAVATVTSKEHLSPIEQSNYLHIEYQSDFIFRIQRGWKNYPPLYLGMHRYFSASELTEHKQQWLIFLDVQQHFIKAVPLSEASSYLELLGTENWSFDRHGNLNRKP